MSYLGVFDEVVKIMKTDYSGCEIKSKWGNDQKYREILLKEIQEGIERERFVEIVQEYMLGFKDRHSGFHDLKKKSKSTYYGFKTRRYEDALYITEVDEGVELKRGMKIVKLDNLSIIELESKYKHLLIDGANERQPWDNIIKKMKDITIENEDGSLYNYRLKSIKNNNGGSKYSFKKLDQDTNIITFNDCMDGEQMNNLLEENKEALCSKENLIVDVRVNGGGIDGVYFGLLNYIFPQDTDFKSIEDDDYEVLTLITDRTFENRKKLIESMLNDSNRELFSGYIEAMKANLNKGFLPIHFDFGGGLDKIGSEYPKKVVIITDAYCGSSGDQFVITSKKSDKVTVIGRNTAGIIDYSNVAFEMFPDDYRIMYATSVSSRVLEGKGYDNVGVPVDVYIPWTPEHIKRDVDLEKAIEILNI